MLLVLTGVLVYQDTSVRTRNATFISIASQMQFHTQRLAKAAGLAARGQPAAFPQVQDSREQFEEYLKVLRNGGVALGVNLPSAEGSPEITNRIEELWTRWPNSSNAAAAILAAQKDLVALAQNVSQVRVGAEDMANQSQELTGLMQQAGIAPGQVLRANRITFLSERLGRGAVEILGISRLNKSRGGQEAERGQHGRHQQMDRQHRPEQGRRHILDEDPETIPDTVIAGKRALPAPAAPAHMAYDRIDELDGVLAGNAQAQAQIHILAVAEEILVESADGQQGFAVIERGRGARRQDLALDAIPADRLTEPAAPGQAGDVIGIACAIEAVGAVGLDLQRPESARIRVSGCRAHELGQPIGLGEGIRVQRCDPGR